MNFFEHQDIARRQSYRMLTLFILIFVLSIAIADLLIWLLWWKWLLPYAPDVLPHPQILVPVFTWLFSLILVAIPAAVILATLFRLLSLRQGGEIIATLQGGIEVPPDTDTTEGRRLLNIMEEISIASGVPVPRTFVLVNEWGINAFSAGYSPADAVITVTRGAIKHLNRDELQAMLAHEFSHVLNGDMRTNIRLIGGLFGMSILWRAGKKTISSIILRSHAIFLPLILLGDVLVAIRSIGVIGSRLFKAAFTRQRELLADASAVQFTRQAEELAGTLKKMAGLVAGPELKDPFKVEEISHMLFGEGRPPFLRLFATHPPILRRIQRLEPHFNIDDRYRLQAQWLLRQPDGTYEDAVNGLNTAPPDVMPGFGPASNLTAASPAFTRSGNIRYEQPDIRGMQRAARAAATEHDSPAFPPDRIVEYVTPDLAELRDDTYAWRGESAISEKGTTAYEKPDADDYTYSRKLLSEISATARALAHDANTVIPLLLAMLIDDNDTIAARQHREITVRLNEETARQAVAFRNTHIVRLPAQARLPLTALAAPALRKQSKDTLKTFLRTLSALARIDGGVSLFEYCFTTMLQSQVREISAPARYAKAAHSDINDVKQETAILLTVAALTGHDNTEDARRAYLAGITRIFDEPIPYLPPENGVLALNGIWQTLDALTPLGKQSLLGGLVEVIRHDHEIKESETGLLRTICAVLHCPLPPMLAKINERFGIVMPA